MSYLQRYLVVGLVWLGLLLTVTVRARQRYTAPWLRASCYNLHTSDSDVLESLWNTVSLASCLIIARPPPAPCPAYRNKHFAADENEMGSDQSAVRSSFECVLL